MFNVKDNQEFISVQHDRELGIAKAKKGTPEYDKWLEAYRAKRGFKPSTKEDAKSVLEAKAPETKNIIDPSMPTGSARVLRALLHGGEEMIKNSPELSSKYSKLKDEQRGKVKEMSDFAKGFMSALPKPEPGKVKSFEYGGQKFYVSVEQKVSQEDRKKLGVSENYDTPKERDIVKVTSDTGDTYCALLKEYKDSSTGFAITSKKGKHLHDSLKQANANLSAFESEIADKVESNK